MNMHIIHSLYWSKKLALFKRFCKNNAKLFLGVFVKIFNYFKIKIFKIGFPTAFEFLNLIYVMRMKIDQFKVYLLSSITFPH